MPEPAAIAKRCSRCDAPFDCGVQLSSCWCQQLPLLPSEQLKAGSDCYCPRCLAALTETRTDDHVV